MITLRSFIVPATSPTLLTFTVPASAPSDSGSVPASTAVIAESLEPLPLPFLSSARTLAGSSAT